MESTRILFVVLVWFALLYFGGMFLFTKGFLLTRIEIAERSESVCGNSPRAPGVGHGSDKGKTAADLCTQVRFKRAVVLLIDALRYDFAVFNKSLPSSEAAPFQNKMPVIHETVTNFPEQSILFKSLADPPTTTLQRLKGIMTGSLPTFVDAGHNFASFEISEDNFVDQLVQAGKRVTFMGDDTWMTLFNKKFNKAFPFPSFNVKDLHTVDEGILTKLLPEIRKKDWDVVIAHFLGVDHCGHSLGPYHPSMGKKLTQMNSVIKSVIQSLDDDTILFVLGDHGMTKSGDHGGGSPEERSTAMFMYSPRKILAKSDIMAKRVPDVVSQIDFVPTLSLLLGISIPFSNLGAIISPLFSLGPPSGTTKAPSSTDSQQHIKHRLFASRINAKQIHHYITTYSEVAGDFPAEVYSQLETLYQKTENQMDHLEALMAAESMSEAKEGSLLDLEEHYLEYILGVREMCRSVWAKFEMVYVYQGLGLMILTIIMGVLIVTLQHYSEPEKMEELLQRLIKQLVTWTVCASVAGFLLSQSAILSSTTGLIFIPSFTSILVMMLQLFLEVSNIDVSRLLRSFTFTSIFQASLVISPIFLHSAFLTSDSHVINEGRAIVFFVQSILTFYVLVFSLQNYKSFYSDKEHGYMKSNLRFKKFISSPAMRMIMLGLAALVCVRCSSLFVSCREEQYWCSPSDFIQPLSLIPTERSSLRSYRFLLSIGSIAALPALLIYHLSQQGNLSSLVGQVYSIRYAIPLASVCICMFWGQQALPEKLREQSPEWQQVVFPQVAYVMIAVAVILQWGFPLNLLLVRRPSKSAQGILSQSDVSPQSDEDSVAESGDTAPNKEVSKHSKSSKNFEDSETEEQPPLVYGLGTVFSATCLHILVTMVLLLSLLNADGIASSILLMVVEMVIFLEIYAATRRKQLTALRAMPELYKMGFYVVPWYVIGVWSLMASQYFFATGHQATFTAIKFESAYIGFSGDFPRYLYFIPATLVSLNTFGSQIFFAAMLPLILIWPFTRGLWVTGNKVITEDEQQGELNLHTNSDQAMRALFQISTMFLIFQACDLVGTMVAAAVLRRHLMAWSVFAPRFIFQGVAFGVTVPSVLITFLFFAYMQRCLATWISRIQS